MTAVNRFSPDDTNFNPNLHEPFLRRAADAPDSDISGIALGGFLTLRLADVFERFDRTSMDALAYQIKATDEYLSDLYPVTPEVAHLREIVRAAQRAMIQRRPRLLWPALLAFAYLLEQEVRLDEALDVLACALVLSDGRDADEEVATYLQRGRVLRVAGRFDAATEAYAAAGEMALRIDDTHSELLSRIGRGIVLMKRGNLPESEKALRAALRDAQQTRDQDAEARASHDLAVALENMGRDAEGVPLAFHAFKLYEGTSDKLGALSELAVMLKHLGHLAAAQDALHLVMVCEPGGDIRLNALLELLDVSSLGNDRLGFERWRREVEARESTLTDELRADFNLKTGIGLQRLDQGDHAARFLEEAVRIAERCALNQVLFTAERALGTAMPALVNDHGSARHADDTEVASVAGHLRELRQLGAAV